MSFLGSHLLHGSYNLIYRNELLSTIYETKWWKMFNWQHFVHWKQGYMVRSRNCGCLVTWFCYQLIAKPGNKTATVSLPDPYVFSQFTHCGLVMSIWCPAITWTSADLLSLMTYCFLINTIQHFFCIQGYEFEIVLRFVQNAMCYRNPSHHTYNYKDLTSDSRK